MQSQTPGELVGKVISCLLALSMCAPPIGQAMYGVLFEQCPAWLVVCLSLIHILTMLTGDNRRTAEAIRRQLDILHVIAAVLPQEKEQHVAARCV